MVDDDIWQKYIKGEIKDICKIEKELDVDLQNNLSNLLLDLHGYNEQESYLLLKQTIYAAKLENIKKLTVITGKGSNFPQRPGRLYEIVPQWLDVMQEQKQIKKFTRISAGEIKVIIF